MTIAKFLAGNWKVILVVVAGGLLYFKLSSLWTEYQEFRSLKEQTIIQLTQSRDDALIEVAQTRAAMWEMKANAERLELLLEQAKAEQTAIRAEARRQVEVFENHNFEALTKAKPGLIEKLANKATQERMDALEEALNN